MSARPEQFREAAAAVAAAGVKEAAPARPMRAILFAVVAVIVLGAAAYFLVFRAFLQPGPATIGTKYLEAVKAADAALQAQYTTAAAMSRKTSGVALLKEWSAKGIKPTEVVAATIAEGSGDARSLRASLIFPPPPPGVIAEAPVEWREQIRQGGSVSVTLALIREGGAWKVNDVALSGGRLPLSPPTPSSPAPIPEGGNSSAPGDAGGSGGED
ncbi:hypothetical protein AMK68_03360 [candidate division KD3-62 bacterium DG_56]|uniref:Uncharacterized protein n=1 Tax=candidate division KD3-62 bacterium DG_56 TaxID=1704032 RepID=A0A0S7XMG1_9BACT|nr:MAG: hypothetical protein AMK68_03360 [candidate division KD3-62 bacterium DG_56]